MFGEVRQPALSSFKGYPSPAKRYSIHIRAVLLGKMARRLFDNTRIKFSAITSTIYSAKYCLCCSRQNFPATFGKSRPDVLGIILGLILISYEELFRRDYWQTAIRLTKVLATFRRHSRQFS